VVALAAQPAQKGALELLGVEAVGLGASTVRFRAGFVLAWLLGTAAQVGTWHRADHFLGAAFFVRSSTGKQTRGANENPTANWRIVWRTSTSFVRYAAPIFGVAPIVHDGGTVARVADCSRRAT
jgi:hypothetical protein